MRFLLQFFALSLISLGMNAQENVLIHQFNERSSAQMFKDFQAEIKVAKLTPTETSIRLLIKPKYVEQRTKLIDSIKSTRYYLKFRKDKLQLQVSDFTSANKLRTLACKGWMAFDFDGKDMLNGDPSINGWVPVDGLC